MIKVLALALPGLVFATSLTAAPWVVCVDDSEIRLNAPTRAAFLKEFVSLVGSRNVQVRFGACSAAQQRIDLEVVEGAPVGLPDVLGRAFRNDEGIDSRLQIFYASLKNYIADVGDWRTVGRALARVAAHEAMHFLDQADWHCDCGLLRPGFAASELISVDSFPFRHEAKCGRVPARAGG